MDIELARGKVQGPAIGLIIYAILNVLVLIVQVIANLLGGMAQLYSALLEQGVPPEAVSAMSSGGLGCGACLGLVISGLALFAGIKMRSLESYGLCIAGSVAALLPCNCACCCLGLGVGIWSLVTLSKEEVKAAFQAVASGGA